MNDPGHQSGQGGSAPGQSRLISQQAEDDIVLPFQVEGVNVRGRLVRLGPSVDRILQAHAYPEKVSRLLGEAIVLCVMLGSSIKFDGKFTLQMRGSGPVSMIVTDFTTPGTIRGYAAFDEAALAKAADIDGARLLGKGHMAMTVDQGADTERYQGIVEINGDTLTECAGSYFRQSEQIETSIELGVAEIFVPGGEGRSNASWRAGGIMVQHLPGVGGKAEKAPAVDADDWHRAVLLLETVKVDEMTDPTLPPENLLYRLYHEDGVRVFDQHHVSFGCSCSAERLLNVLRNYELAELEEMAEVDGQLRAKCEFCNAAYAFDPKEIVQG